MNTEYISIIFNYRAVIIAVLVLVGWKLLGGLKLLGWILYVLSFPFLILFWHIPFYILKNKWFTFAIFYVMSIIGFIQKLKGNIFSIILLGAGIPLCAFTTGTSTLFGVVLLLFFVFRHLASRFIVAWRPIKILNMPSEKINNYMTADTFALRIVKGYDTSKPEEKPTTISIDANIMNTALLGSVIDYIEENLNSFRERRIFTWMFCIQIFVTIIICIVLYSFISMGIYHFSNSQYTTTIGIGYWDFLFYSFNAQIEEIKIHSALSKIQWALSGLSSLIIGTMLITILFSASNERYNEDIERLITGLKLQRSIIDRLSMGEFSKDLEQVFREISSKTDATANVIRMLRKNRLQ